MGLEMEVETLEVVTLEAVGIIEQLEADNRLRMIDYALETDNIQMFNELTEGLQQNWKVKLNKHLSLAVNGRCFFIALAPYIVQPVMK